MSMSVIIEDDLIEVLGEFRIEEKIDSYEDAVNEVLFRFFSTDELEDEDEEEEEVGEDEGEQGEEEVEDEVALGSRSRKKK